jgi:hypothetical protein
VNRLYDTGGRTGDQDQQGHIRSVTSRSTRPRSLNPLSVGHHAFVRSGAKAGDVAFIGGAGPIGLLLAAVLKAEGLTVIVSELSDARKAMARTTGGRRPRSRPRHRRRRGPGPRTHRRRRSASEVVARMPLTKACTAKRI